LWVERDRARARGVWSRWRKANKDSVNRFTQRRRAAKRGNGGSFTLQEWLNLCEQSGYACLCCREKKPLTVDHVVPVRAGGTSGIENIQPLCRECNSKKGTRIVDYRAKQDVAA